MEILVENSFCPKCSWRHYSKIEPLLHQFKARKPEFIMKAYRECFYCGAWLDGVLLRPVKVGA